MPEYSNTLISLLDDLHAHAEAVATGLSGLPNQDWEKFNRNGGGDPASNDYDPCVANLSARFSRKAQNDEYRRILAEGGTAEDILGVRARAELLQAMHRSTASRYSTSRIESVAAAYGRKKSIASGKQAGRLTVSAEEIGRAAYERLIRGGAIGRSGARRGGRSGVSPSSTGGQADTGRAVGSGESGESGYSRSRPTPKVRRRGDTPGRDGNASDEAQGVGAESEVTALNPRTTALQRAFRSTDSARAKALTGSGGEAAYRSQEWLEKRNLLIRWHGQSNEGAQGLIYLALAQNAEGSPILAYEMLADALHWQGVENVVRREALGGKRLSEAERNSIIRSYQQRLPNTEEGQEFVRRLIASYDYTWLLRRLQNIQGDGPSSYSSFER